MERAAMAAAERCGGGSAAEADPAAARLVALAAAAASGGPGGGAAGTGVGSVWRSRRRRWGGVGGGVRDTLCHILTRVGRAHRTAHACEGGGAEVGRGQMGELRVWNPAQPHSVA